MLYKYKVHILEQMTYIHKKTQKLIKSMIISIQFRRIIYIFSKKSNEYHTKHLKITYIHMEIIIMHMIT